MNVTIYYLIIMIITLIVLLAAFKSSLLKDTVNFDALKANAEEKKITNPQAPFSLARTQLAFWTIIVFSSFVFTLLKHIPGIPELNQVNLILLGIAVSTTAAGKLIDDSQKEYGNLSQNHPSQGFLIDILSDKNGVSIHRLQNVFWTIAVGGIYIHHVATTYSLPDETVLTNNLLLLMGISTGAYVGIKATENSK